MSTITRRRRPYEFLVRWGTDGCISGAHVQNIEELVEGDAVLSATLGDALPVALAGRAGVPLSQVLDTLQAASLVTAEARIADALAAQALSTQLRDELQQTRDHLAGARTQLADAAAEIRALSGKLHTAAGVIAALQAARTKA